MSFKQDGYIVTRHVCPRNCYDACGMLAYTKNGILQKVTGDPAHGYTKKKLCAKGYSYVQQVYHPERLKYPLWQPKRGSDKWERISWEKAMELIAEKTLELQSRYESYLPVGLNKYSGNFGVLHNGVEGMLNSIGPTTQAIGSPCWSAGLDAHYYDFGAYHVSSPEEFLEAKLIILWGVNPAWTAIHSMPYIYGAREKGAKIVAVDPLYTTTAKKADFYIQVRPGSDGALALALTKILIEKGALDNEFIRQHTYGWQQYQSYLASLDIEELASFIGQEKAVIEQMAGLLADLKPAMVWTGFGLQRRIYGGQNIRAINALMAVTGNIGLSGGGVQYAHQDTWGFSKNILKHTPDGKPPKPNREVGINHFASSVINFDNPPLKMLWISSRNLLSQDTEHSQILKLFDRLELIITVDQFMTPTAKQSDLVLPTTTHFEELDVVSSYWHHWVGLNEQAIMPYYESKSDLEIAQFFAKTINRLKSKSSGFPENKTPEEFLDQEFTQELYELLEISHWRELQEGPKRAKLPSIAWQERQFKTPTGKFEFFSNRARKQGLPAISKLKTGNSPCSKYPYWFTTPHPQHGLNSQFQNLDWALKINPEPVAYLHPETATEKGVKVNSMIKVFNQEGQIIVKAQISKEIPRGMVLCYQGWIPNTGFSVNRLTKGSLTDMGKVSTGDQGMAFYDTFVDFDKI